MLWMEIWEARTSCTWRPVWPRAALSKCKTDLRQVTKLDEDGPVGGVLVGGARSELWHTTQRERVPEALAMNKVPSLEERQTLHLF